MHNLVPAESPKVSAWTSRLVPLDSKLAPRVQSDCLPTKDKLQSVQVGAESITKPVKAQRWSARNATDRIRGPKGHRNRKRSPLLPLDPNLCKEPMPATPPPLSYTMWLSSPEDPHLPPFSFSLRPPISPFVHLVPVSEPTKTDLVHKQLAYYFSKNNLIKDVYLRSLFDDHDGGVLLSELIKFKRLENLLASNVRLLHQMVKCCEFLELVDPFAAPEDARVRVQGWKMWLIPPHLKTQGRIC